MEGSVLPAPPSRLIRSEERAARGTQFGKWGMGMRHWLSMLAAGALVVVGCSPSVTDSDEYQGLVSELEATNKTVTSLEQDRDSLRQEVADLSDSVDELTTSLEDAQTKLTESEQTVADESARADAAEAALDHELDRPWPQFVLDQFVEGCVAERDPSLTAGQQQQLCSCMVDEISESTSLLDFMIFSLALVDPSVELNPLTGFPVDVAPEFAADMVDVSLRCFLRIEA